MRGFRVWSDYWKRYAFDAELYPDGSLYAMFDDDDGVPHHENTDLVLEFDTGLKDKNGEEISEGDVVQDGKGGRCFVKWTESEAHFGLYDGGGMELTDFIWMRGEDLEVIGNIHENRGLLEEEEE